MVTSGADEVVSSDGETAGPLIVEQRLGGWTHGWAVAATQTYLVIKSLVDSDLTGGTLGRMDSMTMVLVDAARNVSRGAERLLGKGSKAVQRFEEEHRDLKKIRDRFEHFDAYVRGKGNAQRVGGKLKGDPLDLYVVGLDIHGSRGGGPEGHVVEIVSFERDEDGEQVEKRYEVPTRDVVVAVRTLARDMQCEAGLMEQRHLDACEMCVDPEGI